MKMQEYLKYYSKYECAEISKIMRHNNEGYKAAVLKLILTHKPEDKRVIEAWERRSKDNMTDIFKGILLESKDLEARIEQLRKRVSPKNSSMRLASTKSQDGSKSNKQSLKRFSF